MWWRDGPALTRRNVVSPAGISAGASNAKSCAVTVTTFGPGGVDRHAPSTSAAAARPARAAQALRITTPVVEGGAGAVQSRDKHVVATAAGQGPRHVAGGRPGEASGKVSRR